MSPIGSADMFCAKELAQKKTASDQTTQSAADSQQPQMFDEVLSNASTVQKPEAKATAVKPKAATVDVKDPAKTDDSPTPDIALLMSMLNGLPQNNPAPAAAGEALSALGPPETAVATAAIAPSAGRASNPSAPQTTLADALKTSDPIVVATAAADLPSVADAHVTDKAELFASVLADIEPAAPTPVPLLAVPTHQPSTLTAVAQALPLTAPGVLDELPLTHGEWPAALGHRLLWAIGEGLQKVEISVNPQDMGPINVHIRIDNDKADIRFTAMHSMTREALEASIPRLRDMFSQQGLNLSQAQVFSQTSQNSGGRQPDTNPSNPNARSTDTGEIQEEPARPVHWRRGLVDDYA